MFTVLPVTSGGDVAPITSSLKNIDLCIFLKRENSNSEKKIYDGNLEEILQHQYSGSTMLEVVKSETSRGYNFRIVFGQFPFILKGEDTLTVKFRAGKPSDSFTSAVLTGSTIKMYTNPSPTVNQYGLVPVYNSISVGNGKEKFDENIGSNVAKIVLQTDNASTFNDSTNPQVKNSRLHSASGYNEDFTIDELIAKNQKLISNKVEKSGEKWKKMVLLK